MVGDVLSPSSASKEGGERMPSASPQSQGNVVRHAPSKEKVSAAIAFVRARQIATSQRSPKDENGMRIESLKGSGTQDGSRLPLTPSRINSPRGSQSGVPAKLFTFDSRSMPIPPSSTKDSGSSVASPSSSATGSSPRGGRSRRLAAAMYAGRRAHIRSPRNSAPESPEPIPGPEKDQDAIVSKQSSESIATEVALGLADFIDTLNKSSTDDSEPTASAIGSTDARSYQQTRLDSDVLKSLGDFIDQLHHQKVNDDSGNVVLKTSSSASSEEEDIDPDTLQHIASFIDKVVRTNSNDQDVADVIATLSTKSSRSSSDESIPSEINAGISAFIDSLQMKFVRDADEHVDDAFQGQTSLYVSSSEETFVATRPDETATPKSAFLVSPSYDEKAVAGNEKEEAVKKQMCSDPFVSMAVGTKSSDSCLNGEEYLPLLSKHAVKKDGFTGERNDEPREIGKRGALDTQRGTGGENVSSEPVEGSLEAAAHRAVHVGEKSAQDSLAYESQLLSDQTIELCHESVGSVAHSATHERVQIQDGTLSRIQTSDSYGEPKVSSTSHEYVEAVDEAVEITGIFQFAVEEDTELALEPSDDGGQVETGKVHRSDEYATDSLESGDDLAKAAFFKNSAVDAKQSVGPGDGTDLNEIRHEEIDSMLRVEGPCMADSHQTGDVCSDTQQKLASFDGATEMGEKKNEVLADSVETAKLDIGNRSKSQEVSSSGSQWTEEEVLTSSWESVEVTVGTLSLDEQNHTVDDTCVEASTTITPIVSTDAIVRNSATADVADKGRSDDEYDSPSRLTANFNQSTVSHDGAEVPSTDPTSHRKTLIYTGSCAESTKAYSDDAEKSRFSSDSEGNEFTKTADDPIEMARSTNSEELDDEQLILEVYNEPTLTRNSQSKGDARLENINVDPSDGEPIEIARCDNSTNSSGTCGVSPVENSKIAQAKGDHASSLETKHLKSTRSHDAVACKSSESDIDPIETFRWAQVQGGESVQFIDDNRDSFRISESPGVFDGEVVKSSPIDCSRNTTVYEGDTEHLIVDDGDTIEVSTTLRTSSDDVKVCKSSESDFDPIENSINASVQCGNTDNEDLKSARSRDVGDSKTSRCDIDPIEISRSAPSQDGSVDQLTETGDDAELVSNEALVKPGISTALPSQDESVEGLLSTNDDPREDVSNNSLVTVISTEHLTAIDGDEEQVSNEALVIKTGISKDVPSQDDIVEGLISTHDDPCEEVSTEALVETVISREQLPAMDDNSEERSNQVKALVGTRISGDALSDVGSAEGLTATIDIAEHLSSDALVMTGTANDVLSHDESAEQLIVKNVRNDVLMENAISNDALSDKSVEVLFAVSDEPCEEVSNAALVNSGISRDALPDKSVEHPIAINGDVDEVLNIALAEARISNDALSLGGRPTATNHDTEEVSNKALVEGPSQDGSIKRIATTNDPLEEVSNNERVFSGSAVESTSNEVEECEMSGSRSIREAISEDRESYLLNAFLTGSDMEISLDPIIPDPSTMESIDEDENIARYQERIAKISKSITAPCQEFDGTATTEIGNTYGNDSLQNTIVEHVNDDHCGQVDMPKSTVLHHVEAVESVTMGEIEIRENGLPLEGIATSEESQVSDGVPPTDDAAVVLESVMKALEADEMSERSRSIHETVSDDRESQLLNAFLTGSDMEISVDPILPDASSMELIDDDDNVAKFQERIALQVAETASDETASDTGDEELTEIEGDQIEISREYIEEDGAPLSRASVARSEGVPESAGLKGTENEVVKRERSCSSGTSTREGRDSYLDNAFLLTSASEISLDPILPDPSTMKTVDEDDNIERFLAKTFTLPEGSTKEELAMLNTFINEATDLIQNDGTPEQREHLVKSAIRDGLPKDVIEEVLVCLVCGPDNGRALSPLEHSTIDATKAIFSAATTVSSFGDELDRSLSEVIADELDEDSPEEMGLDDSADLRINESEKKDQASARQEIDVMDSFIDKLAPREGASASEIELLNQFMKLAAPVLSGKSLSHEEEMKLRSAASGVGISEKLLDELLRSNLALRHSISGIAPESTTTFQESSLDQNEIKCDSPLAGNESNTKGTSSSSSEVDTGNETVDVCVDMEHVAKSGLADEIEEEGEQNNDWFGGNTTCETDSKSINGDVSSERKKTPDTAANGPAETLTVDTVKAITDEAIQRAMWSPGEDFEGERYAIPLTPQSQLETPRMVSAVDTSFDEMDQCTSPRSRLQRHRSRYSPKSKGLPTPAKLGGAAAAAVISRWAPPRSSHMRYPVKKQWKLSYRERTKNHCGYFEVNVHSLKDLALPVAVPHALDNVPWEDRDVKQRFLFEHSVSFSRNWFGKLQRKRGNDKYREPFARPDSMAMPMTHRQGRDWPEEWYTTWQSRRLLRAEDTDGSSAGSYSFGSSRYTDGHYSGSLLSGSVLSGSGYTRGSDFDDDTETDGESTWDDYDEDVPECGHIVNVKQKIGERVSRVNPYITSSLRRSRWRRKHFPRGTFPY